MCLKIKNISDRKDARLPEQLQRTMAAEAEAGRAARAKVITADGEMRSSRALAEASDIIEKSPAAIQLRYLQVRQHQKAETHNSPYPPTHYDT